MRKEERGRRGGREGERRATEFGAGRLLKQEKIQM